MEILIFVLLLVVAFAGLDTLHPRASEALSKVLRAEGISSTRTGDPIDGIIGKSAFIISLLFSNRTGISIRACMVFVLLVTILSVRLSVSAGNVEFRSLGEILRHYTWSNTLSTALIFLFATINCWFSVFIMTAVHFIWRTRNIAGIWRVIIEFLISSSPNVTIMMVSLAFSGYMGIDINSGLSGGFQIARSSIENNSLQFVHIILFIASGALVGLSVPVATTSVHILGICLVIGARTAVKILQPVFVLGHKLELSVYRFPFTFLAMLASASVALLDLVWG
ncbi:hypothetical protein SAMN04488030_1947 [Aliiroseovarius halocynthiae]|uniref:Uncharacterized protein n=1 Tax=Aliiroseovarius halocynthiae TaxID=985055 RepID=A0A545SR81_9RHOB|nr:hypothetical protein [Aliiroseovarius halocynthiae]TQV67472.1 hypothetical protein FIL88_09610 [Aliiroseovarius halocynthiae]SMR81480.1 hypothetical protein SAMN04488030_1947 [Aliiroseovarius halocynthiae]